MNRTALAYMIFTLVSLTLCLPMTSMAEDKVLKGKNFHHNVKWQGIEIDDVEGHIIGAYENKGVSILANGEEAEIVVQGTLDLVNGIGSMEGYLTKFFSDGSTIILKYKGKAAKTADGIVDEGTEECVKGTGRFEGIQCAGTWKGGKVGKTLRAYDWEIRYSIP